MAGRTTDPTSILSDIAPDNTQKHQNINQSDQQRTTEHAVKRKQNLKTGVSSTTDSKPAGHKLHKIHRKMSFIPILMDGLTITPKRIPDLALEIHASEQDVAISEAEGESSESRQEDTKEEITACKDHAEVTSTTELKMEI